MKIKFDEESEKVYFKQVLNQIESLPDNLCDGISCKGIARYAL